MPFRYTFGTVGSTTELKQLVDFLAMKDIGPAYPRYDGWIQKTEMEIGLEQKTAIIALSEGRIVGDIIYQRHKALPGVRELKNLRVVLNGWGFGYFLLKLAEKNNPDYSMIMGDAREDQTAIINLMLLSGYTPLAEGINLYDKESSDIVFIKTFNAKTREGIVYQAKNLVLSQSLS